MLLQHTDQLVTHAVLFRGSTADLHRQLFASMPYPTFIHHQNESSIARSREQTAPSQARILFFKDCPSLTIIMMRIRAQILLHHDDTFTCSRLTPPQRLVAPFQKICVIEMTQAPLTPYHIKSRAAVVSFRFVTCTVKACRMRLRERQVK